MMVRLNIDFRLKVKDRMTKKLRRAARRIRFKSLLERWLATPVFRRQIRRAKIVRFFHAIGPLIDLVGFYILVAMILFWTMIWAQ